KSPQDIDVTLQLKESAKATLKLENNSISATLSGSDSFIDIQLSAPALQSISARWLKLTYLAHNIDNTTMWADSYTSINGEGYQTIDSYTPTHNVDGPYTLHWFSGKRRKNINLGIRVWGKGRIKLDQISLQFIAPPSTAQIPPERQKMAEAVVATLGQSWLYRDEFSSMAQLGNYLFLDSEPGQSQQDFTNALNWRIKSFDKHARFIQARPIKPNKNRQPNWPEFKQVHGVPIIRLNHSNYHSETEVEQLHGHIRSFIEVQLKLKPDCWVIDLRDNRGGNGPALLFGLADFFNHGNIASYVAHPEQALIPLSLDDRGLYLNNPHKTYLYRFGKRHFAQLTNSKLFVLINQHTASAAEQLAIALTARPHTVISGEASAAYTSSNELFPINDDYSLGVSTSFMGDRWGNTYPLGIKPQAITEICNSKSLYKALAE
ncbi:MAG: S41 family peptidase, partial [Cellvibrionaceae bacterium]|nr:S41 family peptidase [Cellvibrionaceae bacterium]